MNILKKIHTLVCTGLLIHALPAQTTGAVAVADKPLAEKSQWEWMPLAKGGVLTIRYDTGTAMTIIR